MSSIRDRLGLYQSSLSPTNASNNSDVRNRLGLANVSPEIPKTTALKSASRNEKTDNLSSQRKSTADKLAESRKKYQNFLAEETKEVNAQKVSPLSSKSSLDLSAKIPEMVDVAQNRARALETAVKSEKGKELKADVKEKQNEYNYANYLANIDEAQNMDVTGLQKVINPITSATRDILNLDRLNPEESYYYDEEGNKSYLPSKQTLKQQKIQQESTGGWKIYNDVVYNMTKAVESKVIDSFAPGAGTILYYGDIVTDSVEEAKRQGYNSNEALAYGIGVGAVAATLDKFLGTFGGLSNISDKIPTMSKGVDKIIFKILGNKTASTILNNMGTEAFSEFAEEYVDNALKYVINSDQSGYDSFTGMLGDTWGDAWYAALIGGLSGGVGGVMENITSNEEMVERKQALEEYKATLEKYKPQTVEEAQYKEDQINAVEEIQQAIDNKEQETIEKAKDITDLSDKELEDLRLAQEIFGLDTSETDKEIKNRSDFLDETAEELLNNPTEEEKTAEEAKKLLGLENRKQKPSDLNALSDEKLEDIKTSLETLNMDTTDVVEEQKYRLDQEENPAIKLKEEEKFVEKSKNLLGLETDKKRLDIKYGEKIISNLTQDVKQQEKLRNILSEPSKNKTTVTLENGIKVITPSENVRNDENVNISEVINNTVSSSEKKEIENTDKGRRKSFQNMYEMYKSKGSEEQAQYAKYQLEHNLYEVRHTSYEIYNEELNMLEDPEHYYNEFNTELIEALDQESMTLKQVNSLQNKIMAMERYYGNNEISSYNPTIANELVALFGELGTSPAQTMAARKNFYNANPQFVVHRVTQVLRSMYNNELKKHEGDIAWKEENNPLNINSPYHLSDTQFGTIDRIGKELSQMKDKTSLEYLQKEAALDNYIQDIYSKTAFGSKLASITNKIRSITVSNVLASTRIWTQNIKGNFVNLAQFKVLDNLPAVFVDTAISSKTGMRTRGISFEGDVVVGSKAFMKGVYDTWYELKYDVTLSKFASKYTNKKEGALGDRGYGKTFDDNKAVGHALNRYQDFVNFALTMGDRPYANMYYEQSIYNQRMTNAMLNAKKTGTNTIYKENYNAETGMHSLSYYDSKGDIHSGEVMTEIQYNKFMEDASVQDITEDMCAIAEKEALENTYQDDNTITRAALKMKDSLNDLFHIGEYGFGDMLLKFTRTGSNMAKAVYEHSPLEAIKLTKDLVALNKNIKSGKVSPILQHKVASEFGKLIGGTMTMFIVAALNWSGITNIEDDEDKDKIKNFKSSTTGSRTYSVKLPGLNYNYKITSDSTIGSLARLGVDIEQLYERTGSVIDTFLKSATPFVNEIIDNSFMESVLGLGSSYSNPIDNVSRKIASQPANLLPSFGKDFAYALDGFTDRNTYDANVGQYMINQILNKIPNAGINEKWSREALSTRKTAWGEDKKIGGDILAGAWNTFLLGESLSKVTEDKIAQEVIDVYTAVEKTDAIPNLNKPDKEISYNSSKIELSELERDQYQRTYGKTAYSALKKLMNTSQYKNANDEYKYKLLKEAYDYATEKAKQEVVESHGETFYNATKKDNKYTEYKKPVFEEIIEHDISIKEAQYKRTYPDAYKMRTAVTNWENYDLIKKDIDAIKKRYSNDNGYNYKTRSYAVQTYISKLNGLTSTQKAMLSKLENNKGDYTSYDNAILKYLKSLNLTEEEFKYMYDKLGLGGYWKQYYYTKK